MARDYYEILGVPRDADDEALKRAFRRRARELHPDVNPDPTAETQFKEAARAYEVLSNAETRQAYDRFGEDGLRGRAGAGGADFADFGSFQDIFSAFFGGDVFGGGRGGPRGGDDVGVVLEVGFVESALGTTERIEYDVLSTCDTCAGGGGAPGSEILRCGTCGGQGQVRRVARTPLGQIVRAEICPECRGAGDRPSVPCPDCRGRGSRPMHQVVEVDIPAGIADGQRIRLSGRGAAGERGAPVGDLYVQIAVADDERFRRDGLDVVARVAVPVTDAMVGAVVTVPTVEGDAEVELRAGTQPGDEYLLRGRGFPALDGRGRGDQRVVVEVRVPRVQGEEARAAVERLSESLDARSYREDEGFFDRIKSAFR